MAGTQSRRQPNPARQTGGGLRSEALASIKPSSTAQRLGRLLCGAIVLGLAQVAGAQVTSIDDFEGYASSAALEAAWVAIAPLAPADVTLDPAGITGKSMRIAYDVSGGT